MEKVIYINQIYENPINCFICDQNINPYTGNGTFINVSQLENNHLNHLQTLKDMLNERFLITLEETDAFCNTCLLLLEELYKFKSNVILFEQMFLRQLYRKHNIENLLEDELQNKLSVQDSLSKDFFDIISNDKFICKKCNLTLSYQDSLSPHIKYHEIKQTDNLENCNNFYDNLIMYSPEEDEDFNEINDKIIENTNNMSSKSENINYICSNEENLEVCEDTNLIYESSYINLNDVDKIKENSDELLKTQSTQNIQFLCPCCEFENNEYSNISSHIEKMHPEYDTNSLLIQIRNENNKKCKNCGEEFNIQSGCNHKNVIEKGLKPKKCQKCDQLFYIDFLLKDHLRKFHCLCEFCDKSFASYKSLKQHEYKHKNGKTFKCSECDKIFKTKHGLIYHMPKHTGVYKHYCEVCQKGFMHPKFLEQHMGVHTKEDKYVCDICGTKFSFNSTYRIHRRWHDNPYPFECKECGKKFRHTSVLAVHRRREHSGERPYSCEHCPKKFLTSTAKKRHTSIHSQTLNFNCSECNKNFNNKSTYKQHLLKIHNDHSMFNIKKICEYKVVLRPEYQQNIDLNEENLLLGDEIIQNGIEEECFFK